MMDNANNSQSEIKSWLKIALNKENLEDFSVTVLGNSEKGDGYAGDMIFVHVIGTTTERLTKEYDFVLKCSKRSKALREKTPIKDVFLNEILVYDKLFPCLTQFQIENGIAEPFNSIPKFYGASIGDMMEVLILNNLKQEGYDLWNVKTPLTRRHIDMIINEYGKFHAISTAMLDQKPDVLKELTSGLKDVSKQFLEQCDMKSVFEGLVEEVHDLLKDDLDEHILSKWYTLKNQVDYILFDLMQNASGLNVLIHGDSWNNNFLFQYMTENDTKLSKVAIIDWQLAKLSSPICDLSFFLFSCISHEDIEDMDVILRTYHASFTSYLEKLGSDPDRIYPYKQFLEEWKKYSKYGILQALLPIKLAFSEKEDIPDLAQTAEEGQDVAKSFLINIKDKISFKNRIKCVVEEVVQRDLI